MDTHQRSVHIHDSLSDEGVLMEISDRNEDEEMIKMKELTKYNLQNFLWHRPKENKEVKRFENAKIRKPALPGDISYDTGDILSEKIRKKQLKRVVRNANWFHAMKRAASQNNTGDYAYDLLREEYYEGELKEMEELEEMNVTVKVEPLHEVHEVKDAVKPIMDVKVPKNCTDKDRRGYGVRAMECAFLDLRSKGLRKTILDKFRQIILFWLLIYLAVATPLWLVKGWCCCCFRCAVCFPEEVVREIRQELVNNPPGLVTLQDGKTLTYTPSKYEMKLFSSLEISTHSF